MTTSTPAMDGGPNDDQIEFWNGDVGGRWVDAQGYLDVMLAPFGAAVADAMGIERGAEVIDLGCGCGDTTLDLARRVGAMGRVLAIDVSTRMLHRARERANAAGLDQVVFVHADASTYPFEAGAADRVVSRFGTMFFRNNAAAFANLRRALKPGGRLGFVCWRALARNEWVNLPRDVVLRFVPAPDPAPPGEPGPFAFADSEHVVRLLASAGFAEIACEPLDLAMRHGGSLDEVANLMARIGPASRLLAEAAAELRPGIVAAIREEIASRHDGTGCDAAGAAWLVTARNAATSPSTAASA